MSCVPDSFSRRQIAFNFVSSSKTGLTIPTRHMYRQETLSSGTYQM